MSKANKESAKTENKKKEKVVNDLTFGLKNKNKSKVVQQYVKEVTNKVMFSNVKGGMKAVEEQNREKKEAKKNKEEQAALLQALFKQVTQVQTTETGEIDYKATLCPYFKAGVCEKGKRCKYSHDMTVADLSSSNIDIYTDPRVKIGKVPDTIITCKNFVEAVEKDLYGFNWKCPTGADDCIYMHRLPQGYVLMRDKSAKQKAEEEESVMTLEEKIEEERRLLPFEGSTPVTLATFTKWKADKAARKQAELEARMEQEVAKGKKGDRANFGFMSGKALFSYNPDLFMDDEGAADDTNYEENEDDKILTQEKQENNDVIEESKEPEVDETLFAQGEGDGADEEIDFD